MAKTAKITTLGEVAQLVTKNLKDRFGFACEKASLERVVYRNKGTPTGTIRVAFAPQRAEGQLALFVKEIAVSIEVYLPSTIERTDIDAFNIVNLPVAEAFAADPAGGKDKMLVRVDVDYSHYDGGRNGNKREFTVDVDGALNVVLTGFEKSTF